MTSARIRFCKAAAEDHLRAPRAFPRTNKYMRRTPTTLALQITLLAATAASLVSLALAAADPAPPPAPPRPDVLFLPLHVHVLSAPSRADIDCKLTDDDLARILGKVNTVWRQAGVQFVVTVHREPAADIEDFDRLKSHAPPGSLGLYRTLVPQATRD